jgi:hypothetical protein
MTTETILATTVHGEPSGNYDGSSQDWFSDAVPAANYYRGRGGLQTVIIQTTAFEGSITIEATLDSLTDTATWFPTYVFGGDSTARTDYHPANVLGNFVWLRARIENFAAGTINSVTVNY